MRTRFNSVSSGNSYAPVIILVAALAISTAVFFLYTKRKIIPKNGPVTPPATAPAVPAAAGTTATPPPATAAPTGTAPSGTTPAVAMTQPKESAPPPAPKAAPTSFGFARPGDVGAQMAKVLASGDFSQAAQMAAVGDPTQLPVAEAVFKKIFGEMGLKVGPEDQVKILGQVGEATRLSVPLMKPGESNPSMYLQLDVERDAKMGWKITQFRLPKELQSAVAEAAKPVAPMAKPAAPVAPGTAPAAPAATGSPAVTAAMSKGGSPLFVIEQHADALSFASGFVTSLLEHNFAQARKAIDDKLVPAEKLAGLCIVFEEGKYQLKPTKPLIITVASPNVSWVIAQVESETLQQSTEFGLELQRAAETAAWQVVGLNLSELLGSYAQVTSKLGVPYTPIVQNPKGGESLALYFEYDQAQLHPRAQKQLYIVAELLKSNSSRKLFITGHTDGKGDDNYNVRLSQDRAKTVKEQLAALGVSSEQVVTEGLGKAAPLSPNQKADGSDDPEGRSRNRRAEIFLDF